MTETTDSRRLPLTAALWVVAAAFYAPLSQLAENQERLTDGYRLLVYGAVVATLLFSILGIIRLSGRSPARSAYALGAAWLAQSISGSYEVSTGLLISGVVAAIVFQLADWRIFRSVVTVLIVVAIGAPMTEVGYSALTRDQHSLASRALAPDWDRQIDRRVDAWLIVLDGFPSRLTLEEHYGVNLDLGTVFERHGFSVNTNSLSPYAWTHLSLASLLEAGPVASDGTTIGPSEWARMRAIIGGDNNLVEAFERKGYSVTIVENGWHLSSCGVQIDHCVSRPLLDEQVSLVLGASVLGRLLGLSYDKFLTRGAEHVMSQTRRMVSDLGARAGGGPHLTIIHLLIPHPPFAFDAKCRRLPYSSELGGTLFAPPTASDDERRRRIESYTAQVECSLRWLDGLLAEIPEDDIVGVAGDHGPDSRGQLQVLASSWSMPMLEERLLTLAAFRGAGCVAELGWIIGVTEAMMECVGGVAGGQSQPRAFLAEEIEALHMEVIELDANMIEDLMSHKARPWLQRDSPPGNRRAFDGGLR